jgi:hypothetical protein
MQCSVLEGTASRALDLIAPSMENSKELPVSQDFGNAATLSY